jgi:hypothetical protein
MGAGQAPARHRHRGRCLPQARTPDSDGGSPNPRVSQLGLGGTLAGCGLNALAPRSPRGDGFTIGLGGAAPHPVQLRSTAFADSPDSTDCGQTVPSLGFAAKSSPSRLRLWPSLFPCSALMPATWSNPAMPQGSGTPCTPSPGPCWAAASVVPLAVWPSGLALPCAGRRTQERRQHIQPPPNAEAGRQGARNLGIRSIWRTL